MKQESRTIECHKFSETVEGIELEGKVHLDNGEPVHATFSLHNTGNGGTIVMSMEQSRHVLLEYINIVNAMRHPQYLTEEEERVHKTITHAAHVSPDNYDEKRTTHGTPRKRNRNFTIDEVREIRQLHHTGSTVEELADTYGRARCIIYRVVNGQSYTNI